MCGVRAKWGEEGGGRNVTCDILGEGKGAGGGFLCLLLGGISAGIILE